MQSGGLAVGRGRDVECEQWRLAWLWFPFWLYLWLCASGNVQIRTPSHTVGGFSVVNCNSRTHPRVDDQRYRARESTKCDCPADSDSVASGISTRTLS